MIVVVWLCLSFTCFPNSEGYMRHLFHRCQASGLISQKQELPEKGGLNISSTLNCAGFNATYTHHLSVATRPSSRSGVNKCDWNSAMCCPFLSLCREQKHKAGTWGAHLCRTHVQCSTMELSWAELTPRVFTQLHPLWNLCSLDIWNSHETYYMLLNLHLLSRKKSRKETTAEMLRSKWSFPYTFTGITGLLWDWIFVLRQGPMDAHKLSWALTVLCWLLHVSKDVKKKEK